MEILNFSRIGVGFSRGITGLVILAMSACASGRKQNDAPYVADQPPAPASSVASSSGETFGPFPTTGTPPAENPDRVVLVFGRGLTHGYAYVGVLRALHDLKVPVHAIYATEVGALASAIYLTQPNPNRVDWALLRFNERNLGPTSGKFSFRLNSPERELEGKLREVFGDRRVENLSDRLHIEVQDVKTGEALEARTGDLWRVLRGTLAGANKFEPTEVEGRDVRASDRTLDESFRLALRAEKYPIVVVSVGESPLGQLRKALEGSRAAHVHVPLAGLDDQDLKKRNQAVFSGKSAVLKASTEILGLVGRKPE